MVLGASTGIWGGGLLVDIVRLVLAITGLSCMGMGLADLYG